jgi:hypothetical protein
MAKHAFFGMASAAASASTTAAAAGDGASASFPTQPFIYAGLLALGIVAVLAI